MAAETENGLQFTIRPGDPDFEGSEHITGPGFRSTLWIPTSEHWSEDKIHAEMQRHLDSFVEAVTAVPDPVVAPSRDEALDQAQTALSAALDAVQQAQQAITDVQAVSTVVAEAEAITQDG